MRNTTVALFLSLIVTLGFAGCKSAPKMPWAKTAATPDAESATLAHSAPALPADVAKEAESLASTSPAIEMSTTPTASSATGSAYADAPAFSASAASSVATTTAPTSPTVPGSTGVYPSTGAPSYSAAPPSSSVASSEVVPKSTMPSSDKTAALGSVDMPYNPNAVPPAKTVASATPQEPTPSASRYDLGSPSSSSTTAANLAADTTPRSPPSGTSESLGDRYGGVRYGGDRYGSDRYGNSASVAAQPKPPTVPAAGNQLAGSSVAKTSPAAGVSAYEQPSAAVETSLPSSDMGDRYASRSSVAAPSVTPEAPLTAAEPKLASAPYRPGGTSSYPGTIASEPRVELASKPEATERKVSDVSAPGTTVEPSQGSRYR